MKRTRLQKDKVYHLIRSLKECTASLDIDVESITLKGKRLVFNGVLCQS